MPSRFARLCLLLISLSPSVGCSVALDFDRTYQSEETVFPARFLTPPKEGEQPIDGSNQLSACTTFCQKYVACLSEPQTCHYLSAFPEHSEDADVPSTEALVAQCAGDCTDTGSLTDSQLTSIKEPAECKDVAQDVVAADASTQGYCDTLINDCDALCDPAGDEKSLGACYPGVVGAIGCPALCARQNLVWFNCLYGQDPSLDICLRAKPCEQFADLKRN